MRAERLIELICHPENIASDDLRELEVLVNRYPFVCKTPAAVRALIEGGVPIKEVDVGNMHFVHGKRAINKYAYVDDKDMEDLKWIASKGVKVYTQNVPGDSKEEIK